VLDKIISEYRKDVEKINFGSDNKNEVVLGDFDRLAKAYENIDSSQKFLRIFRDLALDTLDSERVLCFTGCLMLDKTKKAIYHYANTDIEYELSNAILNFIYLRDYNDHCEKIHNAVMHPEVKKIMNTFADKHTNEKVAGLFIKEGFDEKKIQHFPKIIELLEFYKDKKVVGGIAQRLRNEMYEEYEIPKIVNILLDKEIVKIIDDNQDKTYIENIAKVLTYAAVKYHRTDKMKELFGIYYDFCQALTDTSIDRQIKFYRVIDKYSLKTEKLNNVTRLSFFKLYNLISNTSERIDYYTGKNAEHMIAGWYEKAYSKFESDSLNKNLNSTIKNITRQIYKSPDKFYKVNNSA